MRQKLLQNLNYDDNYTMKKNNVYKKEVTALILLVIIAMGCLVADVFLSNAILVKGCLGLSVLLLLSQLKKMNITL